MKEVPFPVFADAQRRAEVHDRRVASESLFRWWEGPPTFDALDALIRDQEAAEMLLRGLVNHYPKAVSQGRLPKWASAAHAIIDLLAEPFADQHRSPAVLNRVGGGGESGGDGAA